MLQLYLKSLLPIMIPTLLLSVANHDSHTLVICCQSWSPHSCYLSPIMIPTLLLSVANHDPHTLVICCQSWFPHSCYLLPIMIPTLLLSVANHDSHTLVICACVFLLSTYETFFGIWLMLIAFSEASSSFDLHIGLFYVTNWTQFWSSFQHGKENVALISPWLWELH